jgi:hypothetical protein
MTLASTEVLEGGVVWLRYRLKTADARRRMPVVAGPRQSAPATDPKREFVRCAAYLGRAKFSLARGPPGKGRPSFSLSCDNSGSRHAMKRAQFVAIGIAKISEI